jgi:hypothetical protein
MAAQDLRAFVRAAGVEQLLRGLPLEIDALER